MKDLVAKRYVKALVDGRDLNSVALISEKLNEVSKAFKSDKLNLEAKSAEFAKSLQDETKALKASLLSSMPQFNESLKSKLSSI